MVAMLNALPAAMPTAHAWDLAYPAGPRTIGLTVGNNVIGGTPNVVSVTVPASVLGTGVAQAMTSDSTQAASPLDGFTTCVPPNQVYIGGYLRQPTTTANVAALSVSTTGPLTNGSETIPFSEISWTSTALGNPTQDIPAGSFATNPLLLRNIGSNRYVENCHTFSYANTNFVAAGIYTGRATYTLSLP